jgi:hypothetical protein
LIAAFSALLLVLLLVSASFDAGGVHTTLASAMILLGLLAVLGLAAFVCFNRSRG